jgi:hypothetical protein
MKKLFVRGNYIIADDNGAIKRISRKHSSFNSDDGTNYIAKDTSKRITVTIPILDVSTWLDAETGGAAYDTDGMRDFFEANTAVFSSASGSSGATSIKFTAFQTGANAPVLTIINNSTGLNPSIVYSSVGNYDFTFSDDPGNVFAPIVFPLMGVSQGSAAFGENLIFQSSPTAPFDIETAGAFVVDDFGSNHRLRIQTQAGDDKTAPVNSNDILDGSQIFEIVLPSLIVS